MVDGLCGQNGELSEDVHTIVLTENECRSTLNTGSVEILDRAMEGRNATGKVTCTNIEGAIIVQVIRCKGNTASCSITSIRVFTN
jgi:hypothetical protein